MMLDGNVDGEISAKMAGNSLHAVVFCDTGFLWFALVARNRQHTFVPRQLHVSTIDAGHLHENHNFAGAFAYIHGGSPGLTSFGVKFEVHDLLQRSPYSRAFNRSFNSFMNSGTSLKSRYTE